MWVSRPYRQDPALHSVPGPPNIATEKSRKKIPPGSATAGAEDDPVRMDLTVTDKETELTTNRTTSTATNGPPTGETLQNCICGWSRITTARGLKIHQGKKKCLSKLSKGSRIDQYLLRTRSNQSSEARGRRTPTVLRVSSQCPMAYRIGCTRMPLELSDDCGS